MAKTPTRTIRVNDRLWHEAKVQAALDGLTLTDVIVNHLIDYTGSRSAREEPGDATGTDGLW